MILKNIKHQLCTMTNSHLDMQGLKTIIPMQPKQLFQKAENAPQLVPLLFSKLENNNHHSITTGLSQIECQNNFFCLYVRYGQQQSDTKHNVILHLKSTYSVTVESSEKASNPSKIIFSLGFHEYLNSMTEK